MPHTPKKQGKTTHQRIAALMEIMLTHLEQGMQDPARIDRESWKFLFGTKSAIVDQVQKLATTLAKLRTLEAPTPTETHAPTALSPQETTLMLEWLRDQKKPR